LLGETPPYLDEAKTRIVSTPAMRDGANLPTPFTPSNQRGVSDHLPIIERLVLREVSA
jgi:hypothetical protein